MRFGRHLNLLILSGQNLIEKVRKKKKPATTDFLSSYPNKTAK